MAKAKENFMQMDKKHDAAQIKTLENKAGKGVAMKFKKQDEKEDKKLYDKAKKAGKTDAQIMKLDEKKDKKLMSRALKTSKK